MLSSHRFPPPPASLPFPENHSDYLDYLLNNLDADFKNLRPFSTPPLYPGGGGGSGSVLPTNKSVMDFPSLPYADVNDDFQRLRVESGVRGQGHVGNFLTLPRPYENGLGLSRTNGYGLLQPTQGMGYGGVPDIWWCSRSSSVGFGRGRSTGNGLVVGTGGFPRRRVEELKELILVVANREEVEMIIAEVKDHVLELMLDPSGCCLVKKLFEVCTPEQITQMLVLVISHERHLVAICSDSNGTRGMQKLLEHVTTTQQRSMVVSALSRITVYLCRSTNGSHVIGCCLKLFPVENNIHLLNVVAENSLEMARDKTGCCVLQECMKFSEGETKRRLVDQVISNALALSEDRYGNYVVQCVLGIKVPRVTADVLAQLTGNYVSLSRNKFGSNVVEKCLTESGSHHVTRIIKEIMSSPDFLTLLQDPYGNFVAQCALESSKGSLHQELVHRIQIYRGNLISHPYGKKVLKKAEGAASSRSPRNNPCKVMASIGNKSFPCA